MELDGLIVGRGGLGGPDGPEGDEPGGVRNDGFGTGGGRKSDGLVDDAPVDLGEPRLTLEQDSASYRLFPIKEGGAWKLDWKSVDGIQGRLSLWGLSSPESPLL